ncbi:MAG: hypothetical protein KatS3mg108_1173 [Isosphaeraceae bacterium]|nr:MAG: hypothetical protein KatS3mg108_1173 [Isosphaeraceae bacterium]
MDSPLSDRASGLVSVAGWPGESIGGSPLGASDGAGVALVGWPEESSCGCRSAADGREDTSGTGSRLAGTSGAATGWGVVNSCAGGEDGSSTESSWLGGSTGNTSLGTAVRSDSGADNPGSRTTAGAGDAAAWASSTGAGSSTRRPAGGWFGEDEAVVDGSESESGRGGGRSSSSRDWAVRGTAAVSGRLWAGIGSVERWGGGGGTLGSLSRRPRPGWVSGGGGGGGKSCASASTGMGRARSPEAVGGLAVPG